MPNIAVSQIDELDLLIYNLTSEEKEILPPEIVEFNNSELVKRAKIDNERLEQYLSHVEDFSRDWELYSESGLSKVYYKPDFEKHDLTSFTFGGESIIKAPLLHAATILAENDLIVELAPTLDRLDILHEVSPLKKAIHLKINLPFPFSNRDLVCEGTGFVFREQKAVCFVMKSELSGSYFGLDIDDECEGRVRMNLKHGFMHLTHIDESTCRFKVVMNVDMKIGLGQSWVGRMVMSKVVKTWIYKTAQASENFAGTVFEKRYIKNPLYRFLAKRLDLPYMQP